MKKAIKEKDVRIRLNTKISELISGGEEIDSPGDETELITDGRLKQNGTQLELSYKEDPLSGMGDTLTTIIFDEKNPEIVNMSRTGDNTVGLVFNAGAERQCCSYNIGMAAFEFWVLTRNVECDVGYENGGLLSLDYVIEIHGVTAERNSLRLEILNV